MAPTLGSREARPTSRWTSREGRQVARAHHEGANAQVRASHGAALDPRGAESPVLCWAAPRCRNAARSAHVEPVIATAWCTLCAWCGEGEASKSKCARCGAACSPKPRAPRCASAAPGQRAPPCECEPPCEDARAGGRHGSMRPLCAARRPWQGARRPARARAALQWAGGAAASGPPSSEALCAANLGRRRRAHEAGGGQRRSGAQRSA